MSVAGEHIAEAFVDMFADRSFAASVQQQQVINRRNTVLASCVLAQEQGRAPSDAVGIFFEAMRDRGAELAGITPVSWRNAVRFIAANTYANSTDEWQILASIAEGVPYEDICRSNHPAMRAAQSAQD